MSRQLRHICYLMVMFPYRGCHVVKPTDKQVIVTLYPRLMNWNQAQYFCIEQGGYLYREESLEKGIVLALSRTSVHWGASRTNGVWIGLHSIYRFGEFLWTYGLDSCRIIRNSSYSHWDSNQPNDTEARRCGLQKGSGISTWKNDKCIKGFHVVCQRNTDVPCNFTQTTGQPASHLAVHFQTLSLTNLTTTACTDQCLTAMSDGLNCWAITYDNTTDECVLYFTYNPFLFEDLKRYEGNSTETFLKHCYIIQTDTDTNAIATRESYLPYQGCPDMVTTTTTDLLHSSALSETFHSPIDLISSRGPMMKCEATYLSGLLFSRRVAVVILLLHYKTFYAQYFYS